MIKEINMGKNGVPKVHIKKKKDNSNVSSQRWHITKGGQPQICKARKGHCRYGSEENHFPTWAETLTVINKSKSSKSTKQVDREDLKYKKSKLALSRSSVAYVRSRLKKIKEEERKSMRYASRCYKSIRLFNFKPNNKDTIHARECRIDRLNLIEEISNNHELLGTFKVTHLVEGKHRTQIVRLHGDGLIEIYNMFTKKKITSFIATEKRIEAMLLKAGEIPDPAFLKLVESNFKKYEVRANELGIEIQK